MPNRFRPFRRLQSSKVPLRGVAFVVTVAALLIPLARGDDSLLNAKRQTVTNLMRDGKWQQAAEMCQDILAGDPAHYQDHLLLARIDDKLSLSPAALFEYQAVRDLLPPTPQNDEQRSALAEAERRIRVLDPTAEKLELAIADFDKKLQALERSARASGDRAGLDRIERLREQLAKIAPTREHIIVDVPAKTPWFNSGFVVEAGRKYEVAAMGNWGDEPYPQGKCDADGIPGSTLGSFPLGALLGSNVVGQAILLGKHTVIAPTATAPLALSMNAAEGTGRASAWGSLRVYIGVVPQDDQSK